MKELNHPVFIAHYGVEHEFSLIACIDMWWLIYPHQSAGLDMQIAAVRRQWTLINAVLSRSVCPGTITRLCCKKLYWLFLGIGSVFKVKVVQAFHWARLLTVLYSCCSGSILYIHVSVHASVCPFDLVLIFIVYPTNDYQLETVCYVYNYW